MEVFGNDNGIPFERADGTRFVGADAVKSSGDARLFTYRAARRRRFGTANRAASDAAVLDYGAEDREAAARESDERTV